jgi:hypothetical protein
MAEEGTNSPIEQNPAIVAIVTAAVIAVAVIVDFLFSKRLLGRKVLK